MATPANQNQHKIPQVYLRKFGYQDSNNQWKVSVLKKGLNYTQQKSIKSFAAEINHFDIVSDDPEIPRMFEKMNSDLESGYNEIITDLERGSLSEKFIAYLLQFIAVQIVRSDYWRKAILDLLSTDVKKNFLHIITGHRATDSEDFMRIPEKDFFRVMMEGPPSGVINRVLLFLAEYLIIRIGEFEILVLESEDGKPWNTSTNPVIVENRVNESNREFFAKESEIYIPISPKYLIYLHFKGSEDQANSLRKLESEKVHMLSPLENWEIQKKIMHNAEEYLIFAGEVNLKK